MLKMTDDEHAVVPKDDFETLINQAEDYQYRGFSFCEMMTSSLFYFFLYT